MSKFLRFMSGLLVILSTNVPCWSQSNGSTITSSEAPSQLNHVDSISQVKRLVRNARAIEDSLLRYEFLKTKVASIRIELRACETNRDGLAADLFFCKQDRNELASKLYKSDDRAVHYLRQRNRGRWENWTWRGIAAYVVFQTIRSTIQRK